MTQERSIQPDKTKRILISIHAAIFALGTGLLWFLFFLAVRDGLMIAVLLLPSLSFIYLVWFSVNLWKSRLVFYPAGVQVPNLYNPFQPARTIPYRDIARIERGPCPGFLLIIPHQGRPITISGIYGSGIRTILNEFSLHIEPGRIPDDLAQRIFQKTRAEQRQARLSTGIWLLFMVLYFLPEGFEIISSRVAWKPVPGSTSHFLVSNDIETLSLDEDGSLWVVRGAVGSDDYQIQHITNSGSSHWRYQTASPHHRHPVCVARDNLLKPWIIWSDGVVSHPIGSSWEKLRLPAETLSQRTTACSGSRVWTAVLSGEENQPAVYFRDFATGETQIIFFPEAVLLADPDLEIISINLSGYGPLLVYSSGSQHQIHLLVNQRWEETVLQFNPSGQGYLTAMAYSPRLGVWVVDQKPFEKTASFNLGHGDLRDGAWEWLEGQIFFGEEVQNLRITNLEVDPLDRIWVSGYLVLERGYQNFSQVLKYEMGHFTPLVLYTEENSGLPDSPLGNPVYLERNGILFYAGSKIKSIDTHQVNLPAPLPEKYLSPVRFLDENRIVIGLILILILVIQGSWFTLSRSRKTTRAKREG